MTSAWDITAAVVPPRSVYVHSPLGHTTGQPGDVEGQRRLVLAALQAGYSVRRGGIERLAGVWADDPGWEARAYTPEHAAVGADGKPLRD